VVDDGDADGEICHARTIGQGEAVGDAEMGGGDSVAGEVDEGSAPIGT
jgi:hypothetical protein